MRLEGEPSNMRNPHELGVVKRLVDGAASDPRW
jgi:hypothetical protein